VASFPNSSQKKSTVSSVKSNICFRILFALGSATRLSEKVDALMALLASWRKILQTLVMKELNLSFSWS
jgi:hypothetical protein